MEQIEVHAFHLTKPTTVNVMTINEFKKLPKIKGYIYRAYQIGYNTTIIK